MAPSPSPKPKSGGGLGKRLTRKVGPLPVWAWAAVILGAYLLWSRRSGGAATADTTAPTPTATSAGSDSLAQVPASGQGSSADNLNGVLLDQLSANTSSLDALTSQLLSAGPYQNFGDAPAAGTTPPPTDTPTAAQPSTPPTSPTAAGATPAHTTTQTTAGVLHWGGLTFTTKAAFDRWASGHGTSTAKELGNHPQARAIYSTLK